MRTMAGVVLIALAFSLMGCMQETTVVKVKPDGTGTVEVTSTMNAASIAQLREQMKQMAQGQDEKDAKAPDVFSEADVKAKAAKMGEGVTFVKFEPVKTDKVEGIKAYYAFKDISTLKLTTTPSKPNIGGGMDDGPEEEGNSISFKLARKPNGNALLTAVFNEKKKDPEAQKEGPKPEQMAMMKQFFKGLHIAIQVEPSTPVVSTTAPAKEGNVVTLMDLDMDQILNDEANFKKFAATQKMSMTEAAAVMKGVEGIKIPTTQEVTIEFGK